MKKKKEIKDIRARYKENEKIVGRLITAVFIVLVILIVILWRIGCNNGEIKKPLTSEEQRQKKIEQCFSTWDGSHIELTELIKGSMNDPDSYEHIETHYWYKNHELFIITSFRGRNAFGGVVKQTISAYSTMECIIYNIEEL